MIFHIKGSANNFIFVTYLAYQLKHMRKMWKNISCWILSSAKKTRGESILVFSHKSCEYVCLENKVENVAWHPNYSTLHFIVFAPEILLTFCSCETSSKCKWQQTSDAFCSPFFPGVSNFTLFSRWKCKVSKAKHAPHQNRKSKWVSETLSLMKNPSRCVQGDRSYSCP